MSRPCVESVLPFVNQLYEICPAGGPLHVQLDDGNLEDRFLYLDYEVIEKLGYSEEVVELCEHILRLMKRLTLEEREEIYRQHI